MANKCHTCDYYDRIEQSDNGLCKRYPPVLSVISDKIFYSNDVIIDNRRPLMDKSDTCGEYKSKT
jgi:hypothetical protein